MRLGESEMYGYYEMDVMSISLVQAVTSSVGSHAVDIS